MREWGGGGGEVLGARICACVIILYCPICLCLCSPPVYLPTPSPACHSYSEKRRCKHTTSVNALPYPAASVNKTVTEIRSPILAHIDRLPLSANWVISPRPSHWPSCPRAITLQSYREPASQGLMNTHKKSGCYYFRQSLD